MTIRCISEGRSLYRIYDKDASKGCHPVANFTEADHWNEKQWGIFWTVNRFNGPRRKENCTEVISWAVDLDSGSKDEQREKIKSMPINPSDVIETARGHHVYFSAAPGSDPENYTDIVERLVEAYDGDKNAKDVCRILRVLGYMHWKGEKPFAIKSIHIANTIYTEEELRSAFPRKEIEEKTFDQKSELRKELKDFGQGNLWERVWGLDAEAALARLSGSSDVRGEQFTFRKTGNGNRNIYVNGKGTSCWIDQNGRIGSHDKGGPTVYQWLKWYSKDTKSAYHSLKKYFPEVFK
jgi:hypothetical protein